MAHTINIHAAASLVRTGVKDEFPEMWAVMQARLDGVMRESFEAMFGKGVPPLNFLRKYRQCFLLYISEGDYELFKEGLEKETSPPGRR